MISIILIVILAFTSFVMIPPSQEVSAAFIGNDGALPAGGTSGQNGGMCQGTIYRIGLTSETMNSDNAFTKEDNNDTIAAKLKAHYKTHMPALQNSIMFVPSNCYTTNAAVGWYEASTGELVIQRGDITGVSSAEIQERRKFHDARVRELIPTNNNPYPNGVFYPSLIVKSPGNKPGDLTALQGDGWKSVLAIDSTGAKSKAAWNYIFGRKDDISNRLKDYIGEDLMDSTQDPEKNHQGTLKYLDLLITLYVLSPDGDQKDFYQNAIKRFIERKDLGTKPITFAVDTAVRFSSPAQLGNTYVYIPSVSYVQWMHGASPKSSITNPSFNPNVTNPSTWDLIKASADLSMKDMPNRRRNTDKPADTDGFTWGYSGVVGKILRTDNSAKTSRWIDSSVVGIMESIVFHDKLFGFMVAGGPHNKPPEDPHCECSQVVTIDKSNISGQLEGNKVGKMLPLSINIKQHDPEKLKDWKELLDGAANLQIKVRLWRSQAPGTPQWETISGPVPIDGNADANSSYWVSTTKEELLRYIADGVVMAYNDNLMNYEIPDDVNQQFKYNAQVMIKGIGETGKEFVVQCKMGESLEMYIKGPPPPPDLIETGSYSSFPEFWSEIKQGSPGNETFEAMAGTPTTRSLYFASGGSEFIVDVEVEYVPDMTSTRTYRSYFTGGVPSEFKMGDRAGDYTVPSPDGASSSSLTINAHQGGTVTATWTGTTPYTGNLSWSDHSRSGADRWNDIPYQTAKSQAQAWASAVNGFTISYTAASDSVTRTFNNWQASISSDSNTHPAGDVNIGQPYRAPVPCSGNPCTGGDPGQPYIPTTGRQGTDGTYSITVTGRIPARIIDGPSSIYDLPMIQDTWTQTITYDYTKITNAKVWKIDRSKVNGMGVLTATDEITASITQGDPTVFYNIAREDRLPTRASEEGRLRFSLEPDQHDVVVWNEGPRTNKDDGRGNNGWISGPGQSADWATGIIYTNSGYGSIVDHHVASSTGDDRQTAEWKTFDERRKTLTEVTAISDFLILQTSSGDQSVMYFDKTSVGLPAQAQIDVPKTSFAEQWTNNSLSAAGWMKDTIHIGSYNGNYSSPDAKYSTTGSTRVATKLDTLPAGLQRPARPTVPLRLVRTGIDVIDTVPNGEYRTGVSDIFYRSIIKYGPKPDIFSTSYNAKYGANGAEFGTAYSNDHTKVNDIVIHNPVSVQLARVIPLPSSRDQRTNDSKMLGGNLLQPTIDYERRLKPGYVFTPTPPVYESRTVANPNYIPATSPVSQTFSYTGAVQTFKAPRDGTYTVEVWGAQGGTVHTATEYEWYNPAHGVYLWYPSNTGYADTYCGSHHPSHPTGKTRGGAAASGGSGGYAKGTVDLKKDETLNIFVGGQGQDGTNNAGVSSGGWNGGGAGNYYSGGGGGASDIRKGGAGLTDRIIVGGGGGGAQLVPNTNYIVAGGSGGGSTGGNGSSHGYWNTQFVSQGGTQTAGGQPSGAVEYEWYNPDHGVYLWYPSNTGYADTYCGAHHPSHPTGRTRSASGQGNAGTWGQGGNYSTTYHGGGGGGYYGGASGAYHGYSGGGGSGYIGGVVGGTMTSGSKAGHGQARITIPGTPAIGSATMVIQVMTSPGVTEPPEDAYEYIEIVHDPAAPVETSLGTFTPGNFINLDYPFRIDFPNVGDFFGNGASGLRTTSAIAGKGFVNGMNTTEWTASKQARFQFFVIYNGRTYAPNTWIELNVNESEFEFYLPLANSEAASALVEFRAIANNAPFPDGESPTNKLRGVNLAANHSAIKGFNIDVVGRIGSFVIEDTGDFRFSNLFKQPVTPLQWLVPNVVRKVNPNAQNAIVGDHVNVRGENISASTNYLDTYGLLPHLRQSPIPLPLSPDKNNITALERQPMRLGYHMLADIQTIGNYYDRMQIIPYYYSLNLTNGEITPVDIYMDVEKQLQPINKFGAAVPGWDSTSVHPYIYSLNWNSESGRRNYSEATHTNNVDADNTFTDDTGNVTSIGKPYGSMYQFGTAQIMVLTERNRTFIGTDHTNGENKNPASLIPYLQFGKQGQRWHFTYGLPSSAVAVQQGAPATQTNIDLIKNNNTVLLVALDIKSVGDTYVLQYRQENGSIHIAGTTWSLASIPYPVASVYSSNKSSADDLSVSGTH